MSKLEELMNIIYDYDDFLAHWIAGECADLYETDEGKSAYEVTKELKEQAFEIIEKLRDST